MVLTVPVVVVEKVVVEVPVRVELSVSMVQVAVVAVVAVVVKAVRPEQVVLVEVEPLPSIIRGQAQAR